MFLELSYGSRTGDKEVSTSKAASSWRYDHESKKEMSLDELISDFQQSAPSPRSSLNHSESDSDTSPVPVASPPRRLRAGRQQWGFADHPRAVKPAFVKRKPVRSSVKNVQRDDSSEDEGAVSPMPRLEQVLRNKSSFMTKLRPVLRAPATTRSKSSPTLRRRPQVKSPVPSSPSLTPPSLSPVTSSSAASSPLPVSEDNHMSVIPDEDSIDALIGKEIRDLNKLISTGSQAGKRTNDVARSRPLDEISNVVRQSTRYGRTGSKNPHSSLRLDIPSRKSSSKAPESPPPPPPPEDDDNYEDSFDEEIRNLRESHRHNSISTTALEKVSTEVEETTESSEICALTALKVRNASNAISQLLLEALKPFEDREQEEEQAKAFEKENDGSDAVIRDAANAELQLATQTIVSRLNMAFAEMTERRKADLKAEADVASAAKVAEKKEKEAAEEKKKTEEKETKEREMEILRLLPMQGKLLTCSADIENVLEQLESTDNSALSKLMESESSIDAEIRILRSHTQHKIQEIEARMAAAPKKEQNNRSDDISWRAVDWAQDNFKVDRLIPIEQSSNPKPGDLENSPLEVALAEDETSFEEVLQRQVLEKLDLTILNLRHVLAIDTKEAAEAKEAQERERREQERKREKQQLEDEQKQREREDAESARRRVMGLTSIDEIEGWITEGQQLQNELGHDRSLDRLMASIKTRMGWETRKRPPSIYCSNNAPSYQNEVMDSFDRLASELETQETREDLDDEEVHERRYHEHKKCYSNRPVRRHNEATRAKERNNPRWIEVTSCSSDSEVEAGSVGGDSERDESPPSGCQQRSNCVDHDRRRSRPSPLPSRSRYELSTPHVRQRRRPQYEKESNISKYRDGRNLSRRSTKGTSGLQQEVARTIQALQTERRQKATWIRSRLCSPSSGRRPAY